MSAEDGASKYYVQHERKEERYSFFDVPVNAPTHKDEYQERYGEEDVRGTREALEYFDALLHKNHAPELHADQKFFLDFYDQNNPNKAAGVRKLEMEQAENRIKWRAKNAQFAEDGARENIDHKQKSLEVVLAESFLLIANALPSTDGLRYRIVQAAPCEDEAGPRVDLIVEIDTSALLENSPHETLKTFFQKNTARFTIDVTLNPAEGHKKKSGRDTFMEKNGELMNVLCFFRGPIVPGQPISPLQHGANNLGKLVLSINENAMLQFFRETQPEISTSDGVRHIKDLEQFAERFERERRKMMTALFEDCEHVVTDLHVRMAKFSLADDESIGRLVAGASQHSPETYTEAVRNIRWSKDSTKSQWVRTTEMQLRAYSQPYVALLLAAKDKE